MLLARMAYARNLQYSYLFVNLLLAWVPMILSLVLIRRLREGNKGWFWSIFVLWILFFPNTFYIATDLIHIKKFGSDGVFRWFDMMLTISFASTGMFLGCLSLYLVHLIVRERFGSLAGWGFAGGILSLGAFGIYLGRSLRLNSWDLVARPAKLGHDLFSLVEPNQAKEVCAFSVTLFFFSLTVYAFIVSIARLHEREGDALEETKPGLIQARNDPRWNDPRLD